MNNILLAAEIIGALFTIGGLIVVIRKAMAWAKRINVDGEWKQALIWLNVDGTWKMVLLWINAEGAWKMRI